MATLSKLDAHEARVRDALILPFKRKIASLTIRTDIWREALGPKPAFPEGQENTRGLARTAITEVDDQVTLLQDVKLPGAKKAKASEAEVKTLLEAFAVMRLKLVGLAGHPSAA